MDHRPSRFVAGGRFGEPDVEWHVDAGEDPNEIAAAVLHHLLVRRLFELHPGRLAAARLAIYTDGSERTASRLLRGDTEVSLSDLIGWIGVAGAELLRDLPFDLRALLPDRAPPLSDDWQPGEWRRPRFAELGGLLDLNWTAVADEVMAFLVTEEAAGRARLLTPAVLRHVALVAVTEGGLPPGVASVDARLDDGHDHFDLVFDVEPRVAVISVGCHLDRSGDRGELRQAVADLVESIARTASAAADIRVQLVVTSLVIFERLCTVSTDLAGPIASRINLPFQATRNLVPAGGVEPYDHHGRLLARSMSADFAVVAIALDKPETSNQ